MGNLRHSVFLILTVSMSAFSDVIPQDDSSQMQIQKPECEKIYLVMGFNDDSAKAEMKDGESVSFYVDTNDKGMQKRTINSKYTKQNAIDEIKSAQQTLQAKLNADYGSVEIAIKQARTQHKDAKKVEKNANDKSADTTKSLNQYSATILSNTSAAYGQAIKCEQNANDAIRDFSTCSSDSKNAILDLKPTKLKIEACITAAANYEKVELVAQSKSQYESLKKPADQVSVDLSALSESCLGNNGLMAIEMMPAKCTQAQNSAQGILGQSGQGNVAKDEEEQKQPQGQQSGNGQPSPQQPAGAGTPEEKKPKANESKVAPEDATKAAADKAEAAAKAEAERIAALNASGFVECTDPANPTGPKQKVSKAFGCTSDAVAAAANVIKAGPAADNLTPATNTSDNKASLASNGAVVAALPTDGSKNSSDSSAPAKNARGLTSDGSSSSSRSSLFSGGGRSLFGSGGLGSMKVGSDAANKEAAVTNVNFFPKNLDCNNVEILNKSKQAICARRKKILKSTLLPASDATAVDSRYQSLEK